MAQLFMSFNENKCIDLHTAFNLAENIAKSKSPKAKFILDLIVEKNIRGYLNLCYAYLRWVDDFVDNPQNNITEKISFVGRQKRLIDDFCLSKQAAQISIEESFLFHFIKFALSRQKTFLIDALKMMVHTIEMDALRLEHNGVYDKEEMKSYIEKNSKAFFDIITWFVAPDNPYTSQNIYCGKFATRLFMLRDFEDDVKIGLINITKEDLELYELDVHNLYVNKNLNKWAEQQFNEIIEQLFIEAQTVKFFPFKLKFFNYYSQIYYLPKLLRIKAYNFNLRKAPSKKIKNEIKVYAHFGIISIKLLITEFF